MKKVLRNKVKTVLNDVERRSSKKFAKFAQ